MRLPYADSHMPVFVIEYLNKEMPNRAIEFIPFNYTSPTDNRVLFNGAKQKDDCVMSAEYGSELRFPVEAGVVDGDNY